MDVVKDSDEARAFERTLSGQPRAAHYMLRLYVTGTTPRSGRAVKNIRAICEENLAGRYDLEVIDIYQHPELIQSDQVVVTPTLVKKLPAPARRLIGDLSVQDKVLAGLDLVPRPPAAQPAPPRGGQKHGE
jgi:circadian clock protein KaiB